jgi:hypothetical protein
MPHIVKGVIPIHAVPANVSMLKRSGMSGRSSVAEIGQCRKSNVPQDWYMMGHPGGLVRIDRRSSIVTFYSNAVAALRTSIRQAQVTWRAAPTWLAADVTEVVDAAVVLGSSEISKP